MRGPETSAAEPKPAEPDNQVVEGDEAAFGEPVRAFERVAFSAEVALISGAEVLRGVTENLSVGGVFVVCDANLAVGALVRLHMSLPDGDTVDTDAVVRRCAVASEGFGAGMGLQFIELSPHDARRVARFAGQQEPMFWEETTRPDGEFPESPELPRRVAMTFLPMIRARAHRLARRLPSHILVDDLVGAGFVGLVDAYRLHQEGRGGPFEAYANARIRGAMLDELRSIDPLSRRVRAQARKIGAATRRLEARHGRPPSEGEVATEIGWPVDALRSRLAVIASGSSESVSYGAHEGGMETPDVRSADAEEQAAQQQLGRTLQSAFDALPPRLRQILELRYDSELSLRDIGRVLGVTESRVCQLHAEAVERMRAAAAEERASRLP